MLLREKSKNLRKTKKNKKNNIWKLFGEGPLEKSQKTLEKPKKTKKTKKNNILSLLPNLFHFQDLWKIVFFVFWFFLVFSKFFWFCIFLLPKTSGKLFFFNIYFVISHPQDIWKILSAMHPSILLSHPLCKMF